VKHQNTFSNDILNVIVRFHSMERLEDLKRALFSLVGQFYRPLRVAVCTQRFTPAHLSKMEMALSELRSLDETIQFDLLNYTSETPRDARSSLINLGLQQASGRFLAFLDYDDIIYPHAHQRLIDELNRSGAAIAFGRVIVSEAMVDEGTFFCQRKKSIYKGTTLRELFQANFAPIHSFVIDTEKVPSRSLNFDRVLSQAEDYDFLLRFCAEYLASFEKIGDVVGEYYVKNDGSNTILVPSGGDHKNHAKWMAAEELIEAKRKVTVISEAVQKTLGLRQYLPELTVRNYLDSES
jgi:hypothetical protein